MSGKDVSTSAVSGEYGSLKPGGVALLEDDGRLLLQLGVGPLDLKLKVVDLIEINGNGSSAKG
jgi:hypothetical protein